MTIKAKIYVEFFIRTDFNKGRIYIIKRPNEYVNEQDAGAKQGTLTPLNCRRQLEIILFYHRFLKNIVSFIWCPQKMWNARRIFNESKYVQILFPIHLQII